MWICEDNIVEVPFDKEHLLERILSPENLFNAYKAVQRNKGCGGIDKMSCEQMLPWLLVNKDLVKCGIDKYQAYMWGNSRLGYWRIAGSYILSRAITNEKLSMAGYATLMGSYIEWHPK